MEDETLYKKPVCCLTSEEIGEVIRILRHRCSHLEKENKQYLEDLKRYENGDVTLRRLPKWEDELEASNPEEVKNAFRDLKRIYDHAFMEDVYRLRMDCFAAEQRVKLYEKGYSDDLRIPLPPDQKMLYEITSKAEKMVKILKQGNDVEVRKNPKGELAILKVKKQNI